MHFELQRVARDLTEYMDDKDSIKNMEHLAQASTDQDESSSVWIDYMRFWILTVVISVVEVIGKFS